MNDPEEPLRPFDAGLELSSAVVKCLPFLLRSCQWSEDEDGVWNTACNERFHFDTGGPKENKAKWCIYCGAELIAVPYPQPSENTDDE